MICLAFDVAAIAVVATFSADAADVSAVLLCANPATHFCGNSIAVCVTNAIFCASAIVTAAAAAAASAVFAVFVSGLAFGLVVAAAATAAALAASCAVGVVVDDHETADDGGDGDGGGGGGDGNRRGGGSLSCSHFS